VLSEVVKAVLFLFLGSLLTLLFERQKLIIKSSHEKGHAENQIQADRNNEALNIRRETETGRILTTVWYVNPFWIDIMRDGCKLRNHPEITLREAIPRGSDGAGGTLSSLASLRGMHVEKAQDRKNWLVFIEEGDSLRFCQQEAASHDDSYLFEPPQAKIGRTLPNSAS
jgi:hypothetical protein